MGIRGDSLHFHMFTLKELCSLFRIRKSYSQNMKAFVPRDGTDLLQIKEMSSEL